MMMHMKNEFEQLLRQNGMQVTAQRLALLRAVSSRPHATADALMEDVRAVIGSVSRQAVYDTLGVLVDKNLIRRIQPAGAAARYEDRVGDNHHHLDLPGLRDDVRHRLRCGREALPHRGRRSRLRD